MINPNQNTDREFGPFDPFRVLRENEVQFVFSDTVTFVCKTEVANKLTRIETLTKSFWLKFDTNPGDPKNIRRLQGLGLTCNTVKKIGNETLSEISDTAPFELISWLRAAIEHIGAVQSNKFHNCGDSTYGKTVLENLKKDPNTE